MWSLAVAAVVLGGQQAVVAETPEQRDARMKWWRDARFGLFIHWGLYAIPAGKWGDSNGYGEWIRDSAKIPVGEYEKLRDQFNPTRFDADEWARIAKDAGMKYVVITSKHHDGFDLFATGQNNDWNVMATPFKRDIMKELSQAVRSQGLTMGWYHSIMDWHHPDYLPRRTWEAQDRPAGGADFERFNTYLRNQVTELLTNYGPIGVMWFDGEWESTWSDKYGVPLYNLCRQLQPKTIVNNRVSNGRGGMEDASLKVGDYSTPEQYIPATGLPGVDWETCMTMNDHWGYNAYNTNWKSSRQLIRNLVDIVSKGGNYLLNVGPKADGTFPTESVDRLRDIGRWMKVNDESIYGTTPSVFEKLPWGRSTTKGSTLYLHVFDWPTDGRLVVPGLATDVVRAHVLGSNAWLKTSRQEGDVAIEVPQKAPNEDCTVIALKIRGNAVVYRAPSISPASEWVVDSTPVTIAVPEGMEVRYTLDGSSPAPSSPLYTGPFSVVDTATVRAASFRDAKRVSSVVEAKVEKVVPMAAVVFVKAPESGLTASRFHWESDKAPDAFTALISSVDLPNTSSPSVPMNGDKPMERTAVWFRGYINAPVDGVHRFELSSDDGSLLKIGDKTVVDNDGLHAVETKSGTVALAKGWHPFWLSWFNATGDASLSLKWGRIGQPLKDLSAVDVGH